MLRRADLLELADMSATTYNALTNRGLIPFIVARAGSEKWAVFDEEHVVRLVLFKSLAKAGLPQPEASALVREHFKDLVSLAENLNAKRGARPSFLFGQATFYGRNSETPQTAVPIVATVGKLDAALAALWPANNEQPMELGEVVAVSATRAMAEIFQRSGRRRHHPEMKAWAAFLGVPT